MLLPLVWGGVVIDGITLLQWKIYMPLPATSSVGGPFTVAMETVGVGEDYSKDAFHTSGLSHFQPVSYGMTIGAVMFPALALFNLMHVHNVLL